MVSSLSTCEFLDAIRSFHRQSQSLEDRHYQWELIDTEYKPYLRRSILSAYADKSSKEGEEINAAELNSMSFDEDSGDLATAYITASHQLISLEHHIVYSTSYQVPVLYFNASFSDGAPLSLDDLYRYVIPDTLANNLRNSPISIQGSISLTEHPVLGTPFWYIHPCNTEALMQTIDYSITTENYIKVWLSFMGQAIHCPVSMVMFVEKFA
ncbi:autophagocytosis associated protein [Radiomyces spectabilis]|uniref:autophagocytosis associated protein n=1 Tax=Radiomyces spectabilis TaxID=64574 RepID=UPI00222092AA|nr:autophagocytosis associated protein [Radiomyces spectabilis]KAI8379797.1 autophagocytosis associated protein [Radiomyces spectabilis]